MNIRDIQELIKREREKKNISLDYLSSKLKTTKAIIQSVENDEEFVEKNKPYSLYLLKAICSELNLNSPEEDIKSCNLENENIEQDKNKEEPFFSTIKEKIFNIFKLSFLLIILFPTFIYIYFLNNEMELNNNEIISYAYEIPATNTKTIKNEIEDSLNPQKNIYIISKNKTWISAKVDGKDKVYTLSKNKKINITFKEKIHFITIGNANDVIIYYKGKKITFKNKKLVHHIFVDDTGIFKNGYNILGEKS